MTKYDPLLPQASPEKGARIYVQWQLLLLVAYPKLRINSGFHVESLTQRVVVADTHQFSVMLNDG